MRTLRLVCFALTTLLAVPASADLILPEEHDEPAPAKEEPEGDQTGTLELEKNSADSPDSDPQTAGVDETPTRDDEVDEPSGSESDSAAPGDDGPVSDEPDDSGEANASPSREAAETATGKKGCGVAGSVPPGSFAPMLLGLGLLAIARRRSAEPRR